MPVEYSIENRNILCSRHRRRVLVLSGGLILMTPRGVQGHTPGKFFKLGALKLHFQHSEDTFSEFFLYFQNNILLQISK